MTGIPTYKGTKPGRAPSAVSFDMFMFSKCLIISKEEGPETISSRAAHVINVGELGP